MKKKILIAFPIVIIFVLLVVLFFPVPGEAYDDGGTREFVALTYKIVDWNRLYSNGTYDKVCIYFGAERKKTVDELWQSEAPSLVDKFFARVIEADDNTIIVEPLDSESERLCSDRISVNVSLSDTEHIAAGCIVEISYDGLIAESYPAQIVASDIKECNDLRRFEYTEEFVVKNYSTREDTQLFEDIIITKIYSNCFFAVPVYPMPYEIKLNGRLSEEFCTGDQVICDYENIYYDKETGRIEADMISVSVSDLELDPMVCYKPIIYLYPEAETEVNVKLSVEGGLTCTYPPYDDGWKVIASPDGTLKDSGGMIYNYLYWEGLTYTQYDMSSGFCVRGEDTAGFLDEALAALGLNRREANEFIVYWLPLMERNPYNIISFVSEEYTDSAKLDITPSPDTLIRVFMVWKKADFYTEIPAQELISPDRSGFTVVEWGGTEKNH